MSALPQSEPPRWPGQTSTQRRQSEQALVERAMERDRPLARLDGEIGAGDVTDEQRVAGEDRDRIAAAPGVAQEIRGVLGPVARRVAWPRSRAPPAAGTSRRRMLRAGTRPRPAR